MFRNLFLLLCFSIYLGGLNAQNDDFDDPQEFRIPSDSTAAPIKNGTIQTFKNVFAGKPGKAAGYGFIIPSGGQFYNKRYWKVPIVLAADAAAISYFIWNRNQWLGFQTALELNIEDPTYTYRGISSTESLRQLRNEFQLDTERAGIAVLVIHMASVIEAFTDRHLMEFDISEDLSWEIQPQMFPVIGHSASFGLSYRF